MFRHRTISILLILCGLLCYPISIGAQAGANDAVYGRFMAGVLGYSAGINLNSVADTSIAIKASKYVIRKVTVTNCSAAPVLAQLALYTGTAASGTNVVAAATLATLTAAATLVDMTVIGVTTTVLTASTLYARNAVVQGTALTCDVYIIGDVLP